MGWPRAGWALAKDTGFLSVGHSFRGAPDEVAVEGDLQGVAIGSVVQEPAQEAAAGARLHRVPVEGRAGLWETSREQRVRAGRLLALRV